MVVQIACGLLALLTVLAAPPLRATAAPPSPARSCERCAESARTAAEKGWRFCPFCGSALAAEARVPSVKDPAIKDPIAPPMPPPPMLAADEDFAGLWHFADGLYRNKRTNFRLSVPGAKWQVVGDPKETVKIDPRAEVVLLREGDVMAIVLAQSAPTSSLAEYALRVRPQGLVRGEEIVAGRREGTRAGMPFLRREYREIIDNHESRFLQFLLDAGEWKYQLLVRASAAALTAEVRGELTKMEDSFGLLGRVGPVEPIDPDPKNPVRVRGDRLFEKGSRLRLDRPGPEWTFVTRPDDLRAAQFPTETVAALRGPDGLFAALIVVTSRDELDKFAASVRPGLDNLVSGQATRLEFDGRTAILVEHRGRLDDARLNFRQLLIADGFERRIQFVTWGPTDAVDKHLEPITRLEKSVRFFDGE